MATADSVRISGPCGADLNELARLRAELETERKAHEQIADYLLPLVGTGDGTSVDAAKKAASELSRLRAENEALGTITGGRCGACGCDLNEFTRLAAKAAE